MDELWTATKMLSPNESVGLQAENFLYAPSLFMNAFLKIINACLMHSFLPNDMLEVNIILIIKKKGLDVNNSSNYRPIAIATTASKIVEHLILHKYGDKIRAGSWEFGYKKKLGTELGVFALKSIVYHYNNNNCKVYAFFLDASKAFDNVVHGKLFLKLYKKGIPVVVIKLFYFWCKTQRFRINWEMVGQENFLCKSRLGKEVFLAPTYLTCTWMTWENS